MLLFIAVAARALIAGFIGEKQMFKLVRQSQTGENVAPALLELKVSRRWQEAKDIVCLELTSPSGKDLPEFEAGAFIGLQLQDAVARSYSLANAPTERHRYVIAVLLERDGLGGSRFIHDELSEGKLICVGMPRNEFSLKGGSVYSLLLAGGIGVAPLMTMAEHLWYTGGAFEMHYCIRSLDRAAFAERISQSPYASRVKFYCSGSGGRLDLSVLLKRLPRLTHLYLCGPQGFMDSSSRIAILEGWDATRIHQESFGS